MISPSFAGKRVWFSQELPNFLEKYVAYTILSRKTCDGEQKLFLRINLHINAHKGIETILAHWTVFCWKTCMILPRISKFSSNICCLNYFYLERHVVESKNYLWELISTLMPTRVWRRFLLIGRFFAGKRVWFSQELSIFL